LHDQVLQEWAPTENLAMQRKAQEIADIIVNMAPIRWVNPKVTVLKGSTQNAFTIGGGYIYLFEGFIENRCDDEIAMVIGHELGHCTADHVDSSYVKNILRSGITENWRFPEITISEGTLGYDEKNYNAISMKTVKATEAIDLILKYIEPYLSRQDEREADTLGAYYMARAGYSLESGLNIWFDISQNEAEMRRKAMRELEPLYFQLKNAFDDYQVLRYEQYKNPSDLSLYVEQEAYLKRWLKAKDEYQGYLYKWKDALFQIPLWFRSHPPISERIKYLREVQKIIKGEGYRETSTEEVRYTLKNLYLIERGIPSPDALAHYNLGVTYGKSGRYAKAVKEFKKSIHIKPDFAEVHYNLGLTYNNLGRYEEAIETFKQAIRIRPDYAWAYNNLGIAHRSLNRYDEAIEAFKKAIHSKPDFVEAHYNLGKAYFLLGNKDFALAEYDILKTLDEKFANKLFNEINK